VLWKSCLKQGLLRCCGSTTGIGGGLESNSPLDDNNVPNDLSPSISAVALAWPAEPYQGSPCAKLPAKLLSCPQPRSLLGAGPVHQGFLFYA